MNNQIVQNNINEHITEYLKYFVNLDNPKYAVMLIGKWGCGKTYYIKNLIKEWKTKDETDNETDNITIEPIYISLNGISDTQTITDKIKSEISPFLYKGGKIIKKAINIISRIAIKTDWDFDNNSQTNESITFTPDLMSIFTSKNESIKGDKILIFDDLERCKIETEELFGYINNFVEHLECKVIVIANEEKISPKEKTEENGNKSTENGEKYKTIKEKLIGQTFEIESDIETAVIVFIEDSKEVNINLDLETFKHLIIELFYASQTNNMRVFRQALLDFRRLVKFIDPKFAKHSRYNEFLKNFLAYFLIVYLEYKTGNDKVRDFHNSLLETENDGYEEKYNTVLNKMQLLNSMYVFPINAFLYYIKKGYIDSLRLNNQLEQSSFFLTDKTQDWEKLWRWRMLNYNEFVVLLDKVWKQFIDGNITQPLVVTHIAGTLLSLIDVVLLKKNKQYIVRKSKSIIKKIFEEDKDITKYNVYDLLQNTREYNAKYSLELKEITDYLQEQLDSGRKKLQEDVMKNLFENLQNNFETELYEKLNEVTPNHHTQYKRTAIFQSVNGKKLGKQINVLNTESIIYFKSFIHDRYYIEEEYSNGKLEDYHKDDLKCLEDLKETLSKKRKTRDKIKNIAISELIQDLDAVIKKIIANSTILQNRLTEGIPEEKTKTDTIN